MLCNAFSILSSDIFERSMFQIHQEELLRNKEAKRTRPFSSCTCCDVLSTECPSAMLQRAGI